MSNDCYFGQYARFETPDKDTGSMLNGADDLVGDPYTIDFRTKDQVSQAWIVNRFGADVGFFDPGFSRKLSVLAARGWTISASLVYAAYTSQPAPGLYWGQMAVIAYDPKYEQVFSVYWEKVRNRLKEGVHPVIDLDKQQIDLVLQNDGDWIPKKTHSFPKNDEGTVMVKTQLMMSERVVEQGRKGNVGCYIVTVIFWIAVIALIIFGLKSCGVF